MAAGNKMNIQWEAEDVMRHFSGVYAWADTARGKVLVWDPKKPNLGIQEFAAGAAIVAYPGPSYTF